MTDIADDKKITRTRLGKDGNERVVMALHAWREDGQRIWSDDTMAAILDRQLAGQFGGKHVTANHVQRSRMVLGLEVATGYASVEQIAHRDAALGLAPVPEPAAPAAPAEPVDLLRAELADVRKALVGLIDRIDYALAVL